ncbi:MAG: GGDEF domain-containing protein [Bdellovibrionales bacterium]|nr:GGDEF domain-containing protein [Bdellovibrionales bacterium]
MKVIALNTDNKILNAFKKSKSIKPIVVETIDELFLHNSLALHQAVLVCSQESIYQKVRSYSVFTPVLMYKIKKLDPLVSTFNKYSDLEKNASELLTKALYAKTHLTNEVSLKSDKLTKLFLKATSFQQYLDHLFLHFSQILEVENITWVSDTAITEMSASKKSITNSYCYKFSPENHLRDLQASSHKEIKNKVQKANFFNNKEHFVYEVKDCGRLVFKTSSSWIKTTYECVKESMDTIFAPLLCQHYQLKKLEAKARIDNLTGLYNYRYLNEILSQWTNDSQKAHFATLFIDLDYFKKVNDSHGHTVGSRTLMKFSNELFKFLGDLGLGIRYGGDEFVVLLENFTLEKATDFAEKFRQKVESMTFNVDNEQLKLTVSIGVAIYPDHAKTPDKILEIADQAMYFGKQKSRNITYIAS